MILKTSVLRWVSLILTIFVVSSAYSAQRCEDLFSSDAGLAKKIWVGLSKKMFSLNVALNSDLKSNGHFVKIDSKARLVLKISYMSAHSLKLNRTVYDAIRSGQIDEIDTGVIVGPKVLPLIKDMARIVPDRKKVIVRGSVHPEFIYAWMMSEAPAFEANGTRNYQHVSPKDLERWDRAADEMGLLEACRKFYGTSQISSCGRMKFFMDVRHPHNVVWEKDR